MQTTNLRELIDALLAGSSRETAQAGTATEIGQLVSGMAAAPMKLTSSDPEPARSRSDEQRGVPGVIGRSLLSGLGVVSLLRGLFGGDDEEPLPALQRLQLPDAVRASVAFDSEQRAFAAADYTHTGQVRTTAPMQVTVNVQAMDSRSFSDHSHEIARAVKEAMLNAHSLNDVIGEL